MFINVSSMRVRSSMTHRYRGNLGGKFTLHEVSVDFTSGFDGSVVENDRHFEIYAFVYCIKEIYAFVYCIKKSTRLCIVLMKSTRLCIVLRKSTNLYYINEIYMFILY